MKSLNETDKQILKLAANGETVGETAQALHLSVSAIEKRKARAIFPTLGAVNITHAVAIALRRGIIE